MMNKSAFPEVCGHYTNLQSIGGLTKREYAAIKIAAGMYASLSDAMLRAKFGNNTSDGMAAISADAVQAADSLLAELEKEAAESSQETIRMDYEAIAPDEAMLWVKRYSQLRKTLDTTQAIIKLVGEVHRADQATQTAKFIKEG